MKQLNLIKTLNKLLTSYFINIIHYALIFFILSISLINYCNSHTIILKSGGKIDCSEIIHQDKSITCIINNNKIIIYTNLIQEITYSKNSPTNKNITTYNKPPYKNESTLNTDNDPEIKKLEIQYWQDKNSTNQTKLINAYIDKANDSYLNNNYEKSLYYLLKLEELIPFDSLTKLKIAYCYYRISNLYMSQYYAQESKKLNKTVPETYFLLADVYYDQNNLFDAKNELEVGLKLKNDPLYQDKLSKILKEIELSKEQYKSSTNQFKIEFDKDSIEQNDINPILNLLEEYYKELTTSFNYYPSEPITVIIYSENDFKEFTKAPDWSAGLYDGKIRLPGKNIKLNEKAAEILKHELVHALITKKTNSNAPPWLQEGLALFYENAKIDINIKIVELPPLNSFPQSFGNFNNKDSQLFYAKSFSFVEYLINQYGSWKIILFLEELSKGKNTEEAFQSTYLLNLNDMEQQWRNYIISTK